MFRRLCMSVLALCLVAAVAPVFAQDGQGQDGGGRRRQQDGQDGGGRGGNFDPAQMQQRMMEGIRDQLNAPDDEWSVIEPKLAKVMAAQRETMSGRMGRGGFGGGRGGGGGNDQQPTSAIGIASRDLRNCLQDENSKAEEIEAKLAAYRAAREKANADLKAAREELKSVLTQRQEAQLVLMGMLE